MPLKASAKLAKLYQHRLDGAEPDEVKPKSRKHEEEDAQILLFDKRELLLDKHPDLRWMFATFNGLFMPVNFVLRFQRSGRVKGVLDVFLIVPRVREDGSLCPGLAMDLKSWRRKPTPEQEEWATWLKSNGWEIGFPKGRTAYETYALAWGLVCAHLGIEEPPEITEQDRWRLEQMRMEKRLNKKR